jgi:hypothetical protein
VKQPYALRVRSSDLASGGSRAVSLIAGHTDRLTAWQDGIPVVESPPAAFVPTSTQRIPRNVRSGGTR